MMMMMPCIYRGPRARPHAAAADEEEDDDDDGVFVLPSSSFGSCYNQPAKWMNSDLSFQTNGPALKSLKWLFTYSHIRSIRADGRREFPSGCRRSA